MASFGQTSLERLATCHQDLQKIAFELIKEMDVTIACGHRGEEDQNKAFANGFSKLKWPYSMHNTIPSLAVDIVPYNPQARDLDWSPEKMDEMLDRIAKIAERLDIKLRFGRDFKRLGDKDHIELVEAHIVYG